MNTKRAALFLGGCMGVRILFVILAKFSSPRLLLWYGILAFLPAIGFTSIYLSDSRKTGPEVFGDKIWWNDLRPVHASLYFLFGCWAIKQYPHAYVALLVDVIIGFGAWVCYHFG